MLPKAIKLWYDQNSLVSCALFDDGTRLLISEKAAALVSPQGERTKYWWKEEPQDPYYQIWLDSLNKIDQDNASEQIKDAVFDTVYALDKNQIKRGCQAALKYLT